MRESFQGRVILLTGVPAVGKSTLANWLEETRKQVRVIHFGTLIADSIAEIFQQSVPEESLRREPGRWVNASVLSQAREKLLRQLEDLRSKYHVIVDSHAVSVTEYGFRSTPDEHQYVKAMGLNLILQLYANADQIEKRRARDPQGRLPHTPASALRHEYLQAAVSTLYASWSNCPLVLVRADGNLEEVTRLTIAALREGGVLE